MKPLTLFPVIALLTILLQSCKSDMREYEYREQYTHSDGSMGWQQKTTRILATSDSAAYMKAYKKYCSRIKGFERVEADAELAYYPVDFRVFRNGVDITDNITFANEQDIKEAVREDVFPIAGAVRQQARGWSDTTAVRKLLRVFDVAKFKQYDDGRLHFIYKETPNHVDSEGVFMYIMTDKDTLPVALYIAMQCQVNEPLYTRYIKMTVSAKEYRLLTTTMVSGNNRAGLKREWTDMPVSGQGGRALAEALKNANTLYYGSYGMVGRDYLCDGKVHPFRMIELQNVVKLYMAMGGTIEPRYSDGLQRGMLDMAME